MVNFLKDCEATLNEKEILILIKISRNIICLVGTVLATFPLNLLDRKPILESLLHILDLL